MALKTYFKPDTATALQAKNKALEIAFAPVTFQVSYALLKLGILELVSQSGDVGITPEDIAAKLGINLYGVKVLLDVGLSCKLVWLNTDKYVLDKTGHFILCDPMVQTNLEFIQDVCYQGLAHLLDSIKSGKPEGLKGFGDWKTIYPALASLPPAAKASWFKFDHYYSDIAFPEVLPIIFAKPTKKLFDIGGNTGKWALQCLAFNPEVQITLIDLPEQLAVAQALMVEKQLTQRVNGWPVDLLNPNAKLPTGADIIWMSQFLDCFSEEGICSILQSVVATMDENTRLYILELFWDRQTYAASAFAINCTSIYFTCLANGNSRMYHSKDLIKLIHQAGLYIDEDIDHIGLGHTLLGCKKKSI